MRSSPDRAARVVDVTHNHGCGWLLVHRGRLHDGLANTTITPQRADRTAVTAMAILRAGLATSDTIAASTSMKGAPIKMNGRGLFPKIR
jgi:hypothetical protein